MKKHEIINAVSDELKSMAEKKRKEFDNNRTLVVEAKIETALYKAWAVAAFAFNNEKISYADAVGSLTTKADSSVEVIGNLIKNRIL
jgi:hypothetical protein